MQWKFENYDVYWIRYRSIKALTSYSWWGRGEGGRGRSGGEQCPIWCGSNMTARDPEQHQNLNKGS